MILRCTKKLFDVIKPQQLADKAPDEEDWYTNLLWFDGRKCLLLTHAATLFTVFEPDVRAASLRDTGRLVTELIQRELLREQLSADTFGALDPEQRSGGIASTDIAELNQALRRNINSARGYQQPIELAAQRLRTSR